MEELYYQLISEYYYQTITERDLIILQEWVARNPAHENEFREAILILDAAKLYYKEPLNQNGSWAKIASHIHKKEEPVKRKISYFNLAVAASLFLVTASNMYFFRHKETIAENPFTEIVNPNGQQSSLILPDSSIVYLNAGSKLKYPKHFNAAKRVVQLEGEAFFDVRHKSRQPFIIRTGKVSTTVLGTSFNIKAFPLENQVAVTVKTGKVGVVFQQQGHSAVTSFLYPDQQLQIDTKKNEIHQNEINAAAICDWRNYKMAFYNASFSEITSTLERTYKLHIELEDKGLESLKLTTSFYKNSVDQMMKTLAELSGSHYIRKNNTITFYK